MSDRRADILMAGLAVLREEGYARFTQPRIAARAKLRQSHLTYYFPTRVDLLLAVGRSAVDRQLSVVDEVLQKSSLEGMAAAFADAVVQHENTRILLALAQASAEEPRLRYLFCQLVDGFVARIKTNMEARSAHAFSERSANFIQAVIVGLAVVDLATSRPEGLQRAAEMLGDALKYVMSEQQHPLTKKQRDEL